MECSRVVASVARVMRGVVRDREILDGLQDADGSMRCRGRGVVDGGQCEVACADAGGSGNERVVDGPGR